MTPSIPLSCEEAISKKGIANFMRGSVVLAMLLHATVNTVGTGLIFPFFSGATLILLW